MAEQKEIKLSGAALKALVRAAETPGVGFALAQRLMGQMGIDALFDLDLRELGNPGLSPTLPELDPQIRAFLFNFDAD